jgi:hypothetical protein
MQAIAAPKNFNPTEILGLAPLRPEISSIGNVIVAPFVSSIRSARSWERYAAKAVRGSVLRRGAQRGRPAQNSRATPSPSSQVSGLTYAYKPNAWVVVPPELSQILGKETERIGLSYSSLMVGGTGIEPVAPAV